MLKKLSLTAFALTCGVGVAAADPISLPIGAPLRIQFDNAEQINTAITGCIDVPGTVNYGCSDNWGILKVSNIANSLIEIDHTQIGGNAGVFFTDGVQGQITGLFYGIDLTGCSAPVAGVACTATGGTLDLYWNDVGTNTVGGFVPPGDLNARVDLITSGTFLVRLNFASGIINGDPVTTVTSDINLAGTITGAGNANGFLNVNLGAGGVWADELNGDWFHVDIDGDGIFGEAGETRDIRFRNTFNLLPSWNGGPNVLGFSSTDPATVLTAGQVPEPASLVLFGTGLGVAAIMARRRQRRKI
jgi:hypothetical protein